MPKFKNLENKKETNVHEVETDNIKLKEMLESEQSDNLSPVEDKELGKIIDESLQEVEKNENVLIGDDKMEKDIFKKLLVLENDIFDLKKQDHDNKKEIIEDTEYIKSSLAQHTKVTYTLMFLSGTVFGLADKEWMPYAKFIYELAINIIDR